jgi:hypothetical protein
MPQLTADSPRVFKANVEPIFTDFPISPLTPAYEGSALSLSSGNARQLNVADTTNGFAGFAEESAGTASKTVIRVRSRGIVVLSVTGVSGIGNVNDPVYATTGNDFTLTASGGMQIGKVARWVSGTTCEVYFEATWLRSI